MFPGGVCRRIRLYLRIRQILRAGTGVSGRCCAGMAGHAARYNAEDAARRAVVLVVEDEPLLRDTTAEYLRLAGYDVIEAEDAAEAIKAFASGEQVDIVFSDVHLPGTMDGNELARWVHRHHREVPVMLTSGYGETADAAALVGDESFATKPYRQNEVVSRIRRLLDRAHNRVA